GSPDHRGVPGAPGRVATLVRCPGEICGGCAYRVEEDVDAILAELDAREQAGFQRARIPVLPAPAEPAFAEALAWVADETNAHFLGEADDASLAAHVAQSRGPSGSNVEYVLRLRDALAALAIRDAHVERIADLVGDTSARV
ncbi:MAG TPA: gamma-glutamylcyclotransferase, partial [Labilithrix sp.]